MVRYKRTQNGACTVKTFRACGRYILATASRRAGIATLNINVPREPYTP